MGGDHAHPFGKDVLDVGAQAVRDVLLARLQRHLRQRAPVGRNVAAAKEERRAVASLPSLGHVDGEQLRRGSQPPAHGDAAAEQLPHVEALRALVQEELLRRHRVVAVLCPVHEHGEPEHDLLVAVGLEETAEARRVLHDHRQRLARVRVPPQLEVHPVLREERVNECVRGPAVHAGGRGRRAANFPGRQRRPAHAGGRQAA